MLLSFGLLEYLFQNIFFTPFFKSFKHQVRINSSIQTYSSKLSIGNIYDNIRIDVVHFGSKYKPLLPIASNLIKKYEL